MMMMINDGHVIVLSTLKSQRFAAEKTLQARLNGV